MITFLEFFGSKLSKDQRKMSPLHSPFTTAGDLRNGEGISDTTPIAKCRMHDGSRNPKVEQLRTNALKIAVLTPADVSQICSLYGITDLNKTAPKKLSNMPITIKFDQNKNCYMLVRDE